MGINLENKENLRNNYYEVKESLSDIQASNESMHFPTWFKQTSNSVIELINKEVIEKFYLDEIIKLGSFARINNIYKSKKYKKLSLDALTVLEIIRSEVYPSGIPREQPKSLATINKKFNKTADEFTWLIQHGYKNLLRGETSLNSNFPLLSADEKELISLKLESLEEDSYLEIDEKINKKREFIFLKNNKFFGLDQKFDFLVKSSISKDKVLKKNALKILNYIILSDDAISDDMGIFGLNDDIELINEFFIKNNKTLGKSLFYNINNRFLNITESGFEYETEGQKKLKKLHPILSIPVTLALDAVTKGNKNINIVTQQIGMLPYLFLYALSIEDHLLGNTKKDLPELNESFFVGFGKNKLEMTLRKKSRKQNASTKQFIEYFTIQLADKSFDIFNKDEMREIYKNKIIAINSKQIKKRIIFQTDLEKFKKMINEIKPYGDSYIKNLGPIKYVKRDGTIDNEIFKKHYKIVGSGKNSKSQVNKLLKYNFPVSSFNYKIDDVEIIISSSTNQSLNQLNKSNSSIPTIFITDQARKAEKLFSLLNQEFLPNNITSIIFSDKSQLRRSVKTLEQEPYNFLTWIIDKEVDGIPMFSEIINPENILFSQEYKLYKSYNKTRYKEYIIENNIITEFFLLIKKVGEKEKEFKRENDSSNEFLVWLSQNLRYLQREILEYPVDFTSEIKNRIEKKCDELISICNDESNDIAVEVSDFLDGNISELLNIGKLREKKIKQILSDNPELNKILVRSKKNAEILNNSNFYNDEISFIPYSEMKDIKYIDSIIYPVFPYGEMKDFIASGGFCSKIHCIMFKEEWKIFDKIVSLKKINDRHNVLNTNKITAEKMGYNFYNEIEVPSFQKTNYLDDDEKDELENYKTIISDKNDFIDYNSHDLHDARLILLDNQSRHIFLPLNGKINILRESENFIRDIEETSIDNLEEGDLIYLPKASDKNISDIVSDALNYTSEKDRINSQKWRSILENYFKENISDYKVLTRQLAENGCKKNFNTVKNWLINQDTIAPSNPEEDISAIFKLAGYEHKIEIKEKCIKAINKVYKSRVRARKKLKEEIIIQKRFLENGQFSVNINDQRIFFDVAEIDLIDESISRMPYSQMHKFTKLGKN